MMSLLAGRGEEWSSKQIVCLMLTESAKLIATGLGWAVL